MPMFRQCEARAIGRIQNNRVAVPLAIQHTRSKAGRDVTSANGRGHDTA